MTEAYRHRTVLRADTAPLAAFIEQVIQLRVRSPKAFAEVSELLFSVPDAAQEVVTSQQDFLAADGAVETVVRFQPSDRLRRLVALGASDVD